MKLVEGMAKVSVRIGTTFQDAGYVWVVDNGNGSYTEHWMLEQGVTLNTDTGTLRRHRYHAPLETTPSSVSNFKSVAKAGMPNISTWTYSNHACTVGTHTCP